MRTLILLLFLASVTGCARSQSSRFRSPSDQVFSPVTAQELEYAKQRLHLLRPDMSDKEVFHALRLSRFQREVTVSEGPSNYRWTGYALRRDPPSTLVLYHDYTSPPGTRKLANVEFDGVSWKKGPGRAETHGGF
jgi:hypothetical protein